MKKQRKFKVLKHKNLTSLETIIRNLISQGWEKSGGLEEKNGIYIQKMIKQG